MAPLLWLGSFPPLLSDSLPTSLGRAVSRERESLRLWALYSSRNDLPTAFLSLSLLSLTPLLSRHAQQQACPRILRIPNPVSKTKFFKAFVSKGSPLLLRFRITTRRRDGDDDERPVAASSREVPAPQHAQDSLATRRSRGTATRSAFQARRAEPGRGGVPIERRGAAPDGGECEPEEAHCGA